MPPASLPSSETSQSGKVGRSLINIAGIVAIATLLSKIAGLVRQQVIASAFGVGPAYDAFNYAYIIPGFLLILLGGINGPFHSAIVSVVAKRNQREIGPLIESVTTLVGAILLVLTLLLVVFAEPLLYFVAPGLGEGTRAIALVQFRIMAPIALLSGIIGIGFGTLNAANQYWLPSLSPIFSSLAMLVSLSILFLWQGSGVKDPANALIGGRFLAYGALAGALIQWLIQLVAQWRSGIGTLRLRFNFRDPGVQEVVKVLGPATFSSGTLYINVWTDLWFASRIPGAAATLDYANLLVQAPLGILSSMILVPFMPVFSRLKDPTDWPELKERIRQGLMLTALTMLPLSALTISLALPVVRLIYERYAFTREASYLVTAVLMAYASGMFVYLARDVLVRVFYALGDGDTPFRISVVNIFLNVLLDALLIGPLGTPGLVLATVGVNFFGTIALLICLNRKLHGLPLRAWSIPFLGLFMGSVLAGLVSYGTLHLSQSFLGKEGFFLLLGELGISALAGLTIFALIAMRLNLPEMDLLVGRLRSRFIR